MKILLGRMIQQERIGLNGTANDRLGPTADFSRWFARSKSAAEAHQFNFIGAFVFHSIRTLSGYQIRRRSMADYHLHGNPETRQAIGSTDRRRSLPSRG